MIPCILANKLAVSMCLKYRPEAVTGCRVGSAGLKLFHDDYKGGFDFHPPHTSWSGVFEIFVHFFHVCHIPVMHFFISPSDYGRLTDVLLTFRGKQLPGAVSGTSDHGDSRRRGRRRVCEGTPGSPATWRPRAKLHPTCDGVCSLHWTEQGTLPESERGRCFTPRAFKHRCCSHS